MFGKRPVRTGFTLVEMLVVIVVIGILMGLLLAALGPVLFTTQNFAVTSEINELEGAIDKFKTKFGFYPPCEFDFDGDGTNDLNSDPEDFATFKQYLRRVAPNHEETDAQIQAWWQNGNGTDIGNFLDNDSILVFWLSGINKSAQYPLTYNLGGDNMYGTTDDVFTAFGFGEDPDKHVFFEFDVGRLVDGNSNRVKRYLQRKIGLQPYLYFESQRYPTAFATVTDVDSTGAAVSHPVYPYRQVPINASSPYYNPTTFQIIAAGSDRVFGAVNGAAPNDDWTVRVAPPSLVNLTYHRDNISNFAGGVMERLVQ
jgi:prepilin-type N-terminal cleavage/methylation domain-containing protein